MPQLEFQRKRQCVNLTPRCSGEHPHEILDTDPIKSSGLDLTDLGSGDIEKCRGFLLGPTLPLDEFAEFTSQIDLDRQVHSFLATEAQVLKFIAFCYVSQISDFVQSFSGQIDLFFRSLPRRFLRRVQNVDTIVAHEVRSSSLRTGTIVTAMTH